MTSDLFDRIRNEPVLLTTIVGSILVLLVQFGVPLPDGVDNTISGLIIAVATLFARSQVTPTAKLPDVPPPDDSGNLI